MALLLSEVNLITYISSRKGNNPREMEIKYH